MASNPNANKLPHNTGSANATPITFFAGSSDFASTRFVTLSANYTRAATIHYPDANPGNPKVSVTGGPTTIPSGTRVRLFSAEAAAVVAAGAGAYS